MRDLKFRAWHIEAKEMLQESYPGNVFIWASGGQPIEVMQFTGLLDKNVVGWWEGDIIQIIDPEDTSKAVIVFEQGSFRKKYTRWEESVPNPIICNFDLEHFEVIGNIHENPELINE